MMSPLRHTLHHARFYFALAAGCGSWLVMHDLDPAIAAIAAGDVFFLLYLSLTLIFVSRVSVDDLRQHAAIEDEGPLLIIGLTAAAVVLCLSSIFSLLGSHVGHLHLLLSLASVPLGWLTLHTVLAFHYARRFYGASETSKAAQEGLVFPATEEPTAWDFLYFSFVLGMTAQVSDVTVNASSMRRVVLLHSIASFFFNTVLLALAVNIAVSAS